MTQQLANHELDNTENDWLRYLMNKEVKGIPAIKIRQPKVVCVSAKQQKAVSDGV